MGIGRTRFLTLPIDADGDGYGAPTDDRRAAIAGASGALQIVRRYRAGPSPLVKDDVRG